MPQKVRRTTPSPAATSKRPGQDVLAAKQAAQFPSVGMTLRSYQQSQSTRARRGGIAAAPDDSRWRRLKSKISLRGTVITVALIVLVIGGWVGGKFLYNAHKLFGGNIFGILSSTKLKGEDSGRVNILLAGNSADDPGHNGADLTDSIMIVSIDTRHNKAFLLSIPRDLWVKVPHDGHEKINGAYVTGEATNFDESGYPSGGMGQLEQIISEDLGVPIDYYALIDYQAFKQAVDAVGGVDINIQSTDPRGLYDPNIDYSTRAHLPLVKLSNGVHHLNGQQALDLARARGDSAYSYGFAGSDFDRTQHQRQLLVALKEKAVSAGVIANPAKLTSLSDAIGNNVKTDFKLSEVRRLYDITKNIKGSSISSLSLNSANGKSLLTGYTTPQGQSALIPAAGMDDYSDIRRFIDQQTSSDPLVQESANVVVLNGTSTNGLAARIKQKLQTNQIQVSKIGDAGNNAQVTTAIIDLSGGHKPATSAALVKLFGNHLTTQNPYAGVYDADFIIVLGSDQNTSASSASSGSSQ